VWRHIHAQISYCLLTMPEAAPPRSADLPDDPATLKSLVREQAFEIERLKEELRLARHKQFGASSEKADAAQIQLFNEAEVLGAKAPAGEGDEITVPAHKRARGKRKPLDDRLPRQRIEHDIADADKLCPCGSGRTRPRIGEIVTEQADIVPAKVVVLQHVRFKYGPCRQCDGVFPSLGEGQAKADTAAADANAASEARAVVVPEARAVIVAPLPAQPIPKSLAAPGLCAWIAMSKYGDGLPLYRQEAILARHGLSISRATLASWMIRLGELIVPLLNLAEEVQLGYDVLQMDETTIQVLKEDGRAAQSDSRMWVRRGGPPGQPVILFEYDPSRSGKVAWRLTQDFKGYLQSDGFSGYDAVGKREGVVHVGCLAHARRKFDEALKAQPVGNRSGLALEGLMLIQRIYRIEKAAREAKLSPAQRKQLRDSQARPIWDELRGWLDAKRGHVPPQMLTGKAMTYLDNQWPQLVRSLDDGRLEVDNNRCENALRPFVLGRKAWLFSDTPAGAEASARLYGLVETAKANGCEPYAYLRRVFTDLPKATTLAEIEALLPWNVARPATQSVAA
jgi:transposase